jgi:hypothetical protein
MLTLFYLYIQLYKKVSATPQIPFNIIWLCPYFDFSFHTRALAPTIAASP